MRLGTGVLADPMRPANKGYPFDHFGAAGDRTPVDPRPRPGERTACFCTLGQSNAANVIDAIYEVTNTGRVDNLSVVDGGTYAYKDPALGCNNQGPEGWGNWIGEFADRLINDGLLDRVILAPISIGSTHIGEWAPGGVLHKSILAVSRRVQAIGLPITAFIWVQGEAQEGSTEAYYGGLLRAMIDSVRADGQPAPWMIGVSTYHNGIVNPGVQAACRNIPNGVDIFAGADTDDLGNEYRQYLYGTNVHYNVAGRTVVSERWKNAVAAVLPKLPIAFEV